MVMGLKIAAIGGPILAAVAFAGGWQVNGWRHDAAEKKQIEAAYEREMEANSARRVAEARIAEMEAAEGQRTEIIREEIKEVIVERVSCPPRGADAVELFNAIMAGELPSTRAIDDEN